VGRLRRLGEAALRVVGTPDLVETPAYRAALRLLREGVLPNGERWADGPPPLRVTLGDAEACVLQRISQAPQADGSVRCEARFDVHPSRAGGAGVSVDGAVTEMFMAQAAPSPCDDGARFALGAALRAVGEERAERVRSAFTRLLTPEDFLWRLVGWGHRGAWRLGGAEVARMALGAPWVEEARGTTWASARWEVWVPATLDVEAVMWRQDG